MFKESEPKQWDVRERSPQSRDCKEASYGALQRAVCSQHETATANICWKSPSRNPPVTGLFLVTESDESIPLTAKLATEHGPESLSQTLSTS